jgi:ABC-type sugar transport system permease subunit
VGLANYGRLIDDDLFWKAFVNNLILLLSIPIAIGIAIAITGLLYKGVFGTPAYRLAIFLPFVPSVAAIGVVFIYLLALDGPFNGMLRSLGIGSLAHPWLTDSGLAIWSIMAIVAWKRIGLAVLLFSARMLSVDRELFQAAAVDGASWWRAYLRIGLPQLRGVIEFFAVLSVIEVFSWTFAYVFVLTQGGPFHSTYTLEFYLYQQQFFSGLPGMASAVAVVLLLVAATLAVYRIRMARTEIA